MKHSNSGANLGGVVFGGVAMALVGIAIVAYWLLQTAGELYDSLRAAAYRHFGLQTLQELGRSMRGTFMDYFYPAPAVPILQPLPRVSVVARFAAAMFAFGAALSAVYGHNIPLAFLGGAVTVLIVYGYRLWHDTITLA